MWGGPGRGNSPDHYGGARRTSQASMDGQGGQDSSTPDGMAAAAFAARMFANAYESAPPSASAPTVAPVAPNFFYRNASAAAVAAGQQAQMHVDRDDVMLLQQQQQLQRQRVRDLDFLRFQQMQQGAQALQGRQQLFEHAALNQLQQRQEYIERTRMLEMMRQQQQQQQQHEAMEAERRLRQEAAMAGQPDLNNIWKTSQENSPLAHESNFLQQHHAVTQNRNGNHAQNADHEDDNDDSIGDDQDEDDREDDEEPTTMNQSPPAAPQPLKPPAPPMDMMSPDPRNSPLQKQEKKKKPEPMPKQKPKPEANNSNTVGINGSSKKSPSSAKKKAPPKKDTYQQPKLNGQLSSGGDDSAKMKARPKKPDAVNSAKATAPEKKAVKKTEMKPSPRGKTLRPASQPTSNPSPEEKSPGDSPHAQFADVDDDNGEVIATIASPTVELNSECFQMPEKATEKPQTPKGSSSNVVKPAASNSSSAKKKKPKKVTSSPKTPVSTTSASIEPPLTVTSNQLNDEAEAKTISTASDPKTPSNSKKRKKTPTSKAKESTTPPGSVASSGSKAKKAKKSPGSAGAAKLSAASLSSILIKRNPGTPTIDDAVSPITAAEYENVEAMMGEFCKVPFLAEFSRPVSLLHPELMELYGKIVHHPMDLGHICRKIRRREYKDTRAIQIDVWRVFSNCIKFHSHPSNRENAIPSFISISMHLREFFNNLWQEFMMPSDAPPRTPGKGISHVHQTFQKRAETRKERLSQVSATILSPKCLRKIVDALNNFISSGGRVDKLDREGTLGNPGAAVGDVATCIQNLRGVISNIETCINESQEYSVMGFHRDLKRCYTEDVFENQVLKKMHIGSRLDRIIGKILVPIYEVNGRGVNQSSVWGCMAAAIWARESKKKPYWPAIVLGILAPEDQREDWHQALTDRNEARLPEKLREQLLVGKRKAEQALKKLSSDAMSYFLVEFMGSHEFIWVRESDIIENFDPEEDVNIAAAAGNITKKRRSTASSFSTKAMSNAIEEGRWALEEFELQLNDACGDGDQSGEEVEIDYGGYNYDMLCHSDDEADEMESMIGLHKAEKPHESDIDEQNELLASDGVLDFSTEGRKKAKIRAAALKKQNAIRVKKEKEKEKAKEKEVKAKKAKVAQEQKKINDAKALERKHELEEKREKRELEMRRKKRARDHDKLLKEEEQKLKKAKTNTPEKKAHPSEIPNKRGRAEAIVKAFLVHKFMSRELKDVNFDGDGPSFQAQTNFDPTGLLGMALAFRSAAGEIPFADNTGKPFVVADWEKIDSETPLKSTERCDRLQEQIDLIEEEIKRVHANTDQRLTLKKDAEQKLEETRAKIFLAEKESRISNLKKKKKYPKKPKATPAGTNGEQDAADEKPTHGTTSKDVSRATTDDENDDSSV